MPTVIAVCRMSTPERDAHHRDRGREHRGAEHGSGHTRVEQRGPRTVAAVERLPDEERHRDRSDHRRERRRRPTTRTLAHSTGSRFGTAVNVDRIMPGRVLRGDHQRAEHTQDELGDHGAEQAVAGRVGDRAGRRHRSRRRCPASRPARRAQRPRRPTRPRVMTVERTDRSLIHSERITRGRVTRCADEVRSARRARRLSWVVLMRQLHLWVGVHADVGCRRGTRPRPGEVHEDLLQRGAHRGQLLQRQVRRPRPGADLVGVQAGDLQQVGSADHDVGRVAGEHVARARRPAASGPGR